MEARIATRNGTTYTIDTSNIGKRAREPEPAPPDEDDGPELKRQGPTTFTS